MCVCVCVMGDVCVIGVCVYNGGCVCMCVIGLVSGVCVCELSTAWWLYSMLL